MYRLGMYEKALPATLSWKERLLKAKQAGFDYVEISIDETDERLSRLNWSNEQIDELLSLTKDLGMPIESMCLSAHRKYPLGSLNDQTRERSLEIMQKALNFASRMGIKIIQLAGYDVYYEEHNDQTQEYFLQNLKTCVDMAATAGIVLGFETMETPFMDTVEKSMHFVKALNSPYLGVYPDMGNLTNASFLYGNTVSDDIALGAGHIFATHIKETIAGHYREIEFGTGTTDYDGAIQELVRQGVRRFVAEFWYTGSEQWFEDACFAQKFAREKVKKFV